MITKPQGYVPAIGLYMGNVVPLAAAGVTFAAVTCLANNVRHKNDHYNYILGGVSAGGILGVAKKNPLYLVSQLPLS